MEFDNRKTEPRPGFGPENCGSAMGGTVSRKAEQQCCRVGIRERVEKQFYQAQTEGLKAGRLSELLELLAKNPEVARILDLLEEVRG